jgi:putative transposase
MNRDRVAIMLVFEFKAYGNQQQFDAVDEALRTVQFIRNKAIRLWMDNVKIGKNELSKYCAVLAKEFPFCNKLNSQARQASAERAWIAISPRTARMPPLYREGTPDAVSGGRNCA